MASARVGTKPWNWRGEPIVEPRGYVLIHVGKGHPLADCRGYAYEHRLVADRAAPLRPGEIVHHDDEAKSNNNPSNLKPVSRAMHGVLHRKRTDLQMPGEDNPAIACACGCGALFPKYDHQKRPRRYLPSHNMRLRGY